MTEALFYHLERRSVEDVLPELLERTLARAWRAVIRCDTAERADGLDTVLWTYRDDSFLPHAREGDGVASEQPVVITVERDLPNRPHILFLVGGVTAAWDGPELTGLVRIVQLFDGNDAAMLDGARRAWKAAVAAGHDVTYWKQSAAGKWQKQG